MDIISFTYFCVYKVYFFIAQLCAIVTRSINATYLLTFVTYLFNLNEQTVHTKANWRLSYNYELFSVHCSSYRVMDTVQFITAIWKTAKVIRLTLSLKLKGLYAYSIDSG